VTKAAAETLFVQVKSMSKMTARSMSTALAGFLAENSENAPAQGKSYGYQSAMGGVIDMLVELQEKFDKERQELVKEESEAQHAYEILSEEKATSNKNDKATIARKEAAKGKAGAKKGEAEGAKSELTNDLEDTKTTLKDTKADCKLNNALYKKQDDLRAGEIDALTQAIEIMSSTTVAGAEKKHVLVQTATSFLQLGATGNDADSIQLRNRLVEILKSHKSLQMLSMRIESGSPFKKVLKMIFDMVSKLQKQAAEEAEAHGWCQGKLSSSKMELEDKAEQVADLQNQKDALDSKVAKTTETVAKLSAEINFLTQDRATATSTRATQKEENELKLKEASEGEAATANAISILKEFYAKGAASAAEDEGKETATDVYGGQQAEAGGVVDIMEVIEADFARVVAQTTEAESSQAADYKKLMNSSEVTVEVKKTEKEHNSKVLGQAKKDLAAVGDQLSEMIEIQTSAQEQYDGFKKQCDGGLSFEERMEARKAEIQSLKEALEVLQNSGV